MATKAVSTASKDKDRGAPESNDQSPDHDTNTIDAATLADGDLGKVQDLLFGQQLRGLNSRLRLLQTHFEQRLTDVTSAVNDQLQQLEGTIRSEFAGLGADLKQEGVTRARSIEQLGDNLGQVEKKLLQNIDDADQQSRKAQFALEKQMHQAATRWSKTLDATRDEIVGKLDQAVAGLQTHKVDRNALSGLLGDIAKQLVALEEAADPQTPVSHVTGASS